MYLVLTVDWSDFAPLAEARRWRAIAAAESILGAGLFKVFGKSTPTPEATDHVDPS
jgi:hypothetical protein